MPFPDAVDVGQQVWGGYNSSIPPANLPPGSSPYNQDVMYPEGAVRTRDGLSSVYATPANIASIEPYLNAPVSNPPLAVLLDTLGNVYSAATSVSLIDDAATAGSLMSGTQIFSRIYAAFGSTLGGTDIPRQYDGTYLDRVSQSGPGQAPGVADYAPTSTIATVTPLTPLTIASISSDAISASVIDVVLATPLIVKNGVTLTIVGDEIDISGTASYNGTFTITAITGPSSFQFFMAAPPGTTETAGDVDFGLIDVAIGTLLAPYALPNLNGASISGSSVVGYNVSNYTLRQSGRISSHPHYYLCSSSVFGLGSSAGGTLTFQGAISSGLHQLSVCFITRQGYITKPAPPVSWTAAGSKKALVGNIPTGPFNVVGRLLVFTAAIVAPATTGTFYSITSTMQINDNTSTSAVVDFTDTNLIAGFNAEYLFGEIVLGECAGANSYNERTLWVGERARLQNMLNTDFDGGWSLGTGTGGSDVPLGWSSDITNGAGGSRSQGVNPYGGADVVWGDAYKITGDGVTSTRGMITQGVWQDYLGVTILSPQSTYGIRVRLLKGGSLSNQGSINFDVISPSQNVTYGTFYVYSSNITSTGFTEFLGQLVGNTFTAYPSDLILRVYATGTLPSGGWIIADNIEIYALAAPYNDSVARFSYASNPEAIDGVTGQVQVRPGDGQKLRASFVIRGNCYLAKDRYLGYVVDDGQNEPSFWQFVEVSQTVGICGPNAIDTGEEWAAFANRDGLYVFWGGDPIKISQEIQEDASQTGKPCWNSINWAAGTKIWVRIDEQNKRILVGVPMGANQTTVNLVWQIDYKFAYGGAGLAGSGGAQYGAFQPSVLLEHGGGRKWSPWSISASGCAIVEQADETEQTWFGGSFGVSWLKPYNYSDNGAAINAIYQSAAAPDMQQEEMLQLRSHRKHADYATGRAVGRGSMQMSIITPYRTTPVRAITLSSNPVDFERNIEVHAERFIFEFEGDAIAGDWWQLEKFIPMMKVDPTMPVRGIGP